MGVRAVALAAGLMVLGAACPAAADEAQEMALAREIMELGGMIEQMDQMVDIMLPSVVEEVRTSGQLSASQAERFGQLFAEEFRAEMPGLIDLGVRLYVDAFSEAELRDLRNFYASPAGRALRAKTPGIVAATSQAGMRIGQATGERAAQRLLEEMGVRENKS